MNGGGALGLRTLLLALEVHRAQMGSEPGKRGWGAAREGSGRKVPERGGLTSLSRAALHGVPVQTGREYTSLGGHLSPLGCGERGTVAQNLLHRCGHQALQVSLGKEDSGSVELPEK